jgi:hypothetical protein
MTASTPPGGGSWRAGSEPSAFGSKSMMANAENLSSHSLNVAAHASISFFEGPRFLKNARDENSFNQVYLFFCRNLM